MFCDNSRLEKMIGYNDRLEKDPGDNSKLAKMLNNNGRNLKVLGNSLLPKIISNLSNLYTIRHHAHIEAFQY